ncbi:MAG: hypothetical protein ABI431_05415 [Candidatus Tumulicola sp.]
MIRLRAAYAVLFAVATLLSACAKQDAGEGRTPAARSVIVDDRRVGSRADQFLYSGRWERVRGRHDGRYAGTSTRSFTPGDTVSLFYFGRRCELFGVVGPEGGPATLVDGTHHTINFHAPSVQMKSVYLSPWLPDGPHTMVVTVGVQTKGSARNGYVNIDYARIDR